MTTIGTATLELRGESAQFIASMQKAGRAFEAFGANIEGKFKRFDKEFDRSFGALGERMAGFGRKLSTHVTLPLAALGTGIVAAGTKMDTLRRALLAVAGSAEEADRQFAELVEVAKLPGLGLAEAVQGSVRLQAVGVDARVAARSLTAFGNAIATTGGGRGELERVTVQLAQMLAKGKILQQDLRFIIENAPAVGKALRDAFGTVDPQEIEALGLSTDQFLDALLTQLEKLPKVTGGPRNAFENLQDSLLRAGDAIAKTFLPALTKLVDAFGGFLNRMDQVNPETLRWAVSIGLVAAAMGPLIAIAGNLVTVLATLVTVFNIGLGTALAVGGPLLIGLAALAALFIKNKIEAAAAAASIKDFNSVLQGTSGIAVQEQIDQLERLRRLISLQGGARSKDAQSLTKALGIADDPDDIANNVGLALETIDFRLQLLRKRIKELHSETGGGGTKPIITPPDPKDFDEVFNALVRVVELGIASREETQKLRDIMLQQRLIGLDLTVDAEKRADALERSRTAAEALLAIARTTVGVGDVRRANLPQPGTVSAGNIPTADALRRELEELKENKALQQFQAVALTIASNVGDAFVDAAFGAKDAFSNFVRAALADLARLAARMLIIRAITAAFPGSQFVQAFFGLTPRAAGGPVMRNHAYLVGERGPELFVPRQSGDVVANRSLGGTFRFDLSQLPPIPGPLPPEVAATHDWYRRLISYALIDHEDRNGP
jgi:tape measure domain-containing protein